jgi:hypothetical protein
MIDPGIQFHAAPIAVHEQARIIIGRHDQEKYLLPLKPRGD